MSSDEEITAMILKCAIKCIAKSGNVSRLPALSEAKHRPALEELPMNFPRIQYHHQTVPPKSRRYRKNQQRPRPSLQLRLPRNQLQLKRLRCHRRKQTLLLMNKARRKINRQPLRSRKQPTRKNRLSPDPRRMFRNRRLEQKHRILRRRNRPLSHLTNFLRLVLRRHLVST